MTEPRTQSGRELLANPDIDLDGYGYVLPDDWSDRITAIENETRAALLDELEAAVKELQQHERELASRTDVAPLVTNDAESRIRAYARIHEFIQQHRETT